MLKRCFITDPVLRFDNIILRNSSFPVFKTSRPIHFEKNAFGADIREIVRSKGKAICVNYMEAGNDLIKVVGYRTRILDLTTLLLFYSSHGKFFFGEYSFSNKHKEAWGQIAVALFDKYSISDQGERKQFYIEDDNGSILCFHDDGFVLSIKYFNSAACVPYEQLRYMFTQSKVVSGVPVQDSFVNSMSDRL
jgi:hypothetical protein